ncbi:hypothetical protein RclHR1_06050018 [Rhizophagus clarus]|uniref:Protein N-lysine methyltransferase METTL21A isoform X1 n=1 Tax=Rhizophagus clarus TaxID=94130 RepID=A0A2Z6S796_9GLOM|nr:hypothetical protein RclHR1_06050018 [Rhizophagus clarus]GES88503.1 protein N-lysine methyltransferase METTL21A isoform X1 [Rhizophagus clarus]
MSPSQFPKYPRLNWKDCPRPPNDFEELNNAYATGDYTTAIELLNHLLTNITGQVNIPKRYEAFEHILLAQTVCFQQMKEYERVVSNTGEVLRITDINITSHEVDSSNDHIFCRILALWLRSLAFEALENWERAKKDLEKLKALILERNKNNTITFKTEGVLSIFLPHITPLIAQQKVNSILFNLHCVNDRQRRMKNLIANDAMRRNNSSQAFSLIDKDSGNYNELAKKFHYRLLLRRPLHPNIHVNMWYTLDLMFVSEMGLFKREDLVGIQGYTLGCKLLEINGEEKSEKYEVQVRPMSAESREWSDCSDTRWAGVQNGGKGGLEFRIVCTKKQLTVSDCSSGESDKFSKSNGPNGSNGFLNSEFFDENVDGLERKNSSSSNSPLQLYLYVYPILEIVSNDKDENSDLSSNNDINDNVNKKFTEIDNNEGHSRYVQKNHLVPLAIGPIHIVNCETYLSSCVHHLPPNVFIPAESRFVTIQSMPLCDSDSPSRKKSPWSIDDSLVDNYRGFDLPDGKYLIIKELWDAGIPGKVWDSAFIMVQMIEDKIRRHRNLFFGKRILDLSTGTGFVGLYLAAFLSTIQSDKSGEKTDNIKTDIILTDLDYALKLVRGNLELNKHILDSNSKVTVDVDSLRWGDLTKAKKFGVLDYVLASDVVYEPDLFDSLIQTLLSVCTPGRTKIYLGYKKRGLSKDEEARFFDKLRNKFQRSVVQGLGNLAEERKVNVYELSRK